MSARTERAAARVRRAPEELRAWWPRFAAGVRHPHRWLTDLSGDGPVYALLVLFGLNAVDELDRTAFAILVPEIRDAYGFSNTGILTLIALVAFGALSLQVPIAYAADRFSRVRMAAGGTAMLAIFSFLTGLAPIWWVLIIVRVGSGIGRAVVDPTHNPLLADYYPVEVRPRVYSFHRAANAVGQFVGPLVAGVLASWVGWQLPFLVFAVPSVLMFFLALRLVEPVRGAQERRAMGASDEAIATEEEPPSFGEAWRMTWKTETLRRIFTAMPFLAASLIGFASLAGLLYEEAFGLEAYQRGVVAACVEPIQLIGLMIGARIGTRLIARDPALIMRFLALASIVASAFSAAFALAPNVGLAIVANAGISISLAIVGPGILAVLSLAIPARARSVGFSMASIWVIPGLLMLPLIGWIADNVGIRAGMVMMVPVFVAGGLIISSAQSCIGRDIKDAWTSMAARSEVLYERRQGRAELLLVRDLEVFYGHLQVLFGVSLEIDEGEIVALLGTNGAGKSTLLKAISGIAEADRGAVIFDGRDVTHAPPSEIARRGIIQMPGGAGVFGSLTVEENLRAGAWTQRNAAGEVEASLRRVHELFPVLSKRLDTPAADLSGGQQQMLALAMSFLCRPRLLMIDELSMGLAPVVVEQLLPILREMAEQGVTIILVEQSVNVALTVAETAYFMEKGQIRFHGPTAELLDRPDLLRSVFLEGAGPVGDETAPGLAPARPARPRNGGPPGVEPEVAPLLEVTGITCSFGGVRAVDGVDGEVATGEIVGLIGPNGAGKTTLMDAVSGFTPCDAGRIVLDGIELTGRSPNERAASGLGRSFQDGRLWPALTVAETLAVALDGSLEVRDPVLAALRMPAAYDSERKARLRVDELIELFNLGRFADTFTGELSTGSRRVVDLACVVAHRPKVVLLDEPSTGIAQREAEALADLLLGVRDDLGASLLVIEHDMALLTAIADRLVAMDAGQVVATGDPDDVLTDPAVVASYLGTDAAVIGRSGTR